MITPKIPDLRADSLLTSYQVGALLQVNPSSVNKWVKDGRIPAFRTPGGHRRIRAGDLVAFLTEHRMPMPQHLAQAARQRLLLVSEDAQGLQQIQQLLGPYAERLHIYTANNGVDALVSVGSLKPHVVVLDLAMAGMDGLEICRRLHEGSETRQIDVLIACRELTGDLQRRAKLAGAKACITQPIELETLLHHLKMGAASE